MPQYRPRSAILTLFSIIGIAFFGLMVLEYLLARIETLAALVPLPAPLGLVGFFEGVPQWASISLTVTIWLGLLGAWLLALRERAAVPVLTLTLIAALVHLVWAGLAYVDGHVLIGTVRPVGMALSHVLITFGLWLYARSAKSSGALD